MKKSLLSFLDGDQGEALSNNLTGLVFGLFIFQLSMFVASFLFKTSYLIVHITALLLVFFAYILFKDKAKEESKELSLKIVKLGVAIFLTAIVNHYFFMGLDKVTDPELRLELSKVMIFLDLAVLIGSFALMRHERVVELSENMNESSVSTWLTGGNETLELGDAVLGKDTETKKTVRLPLKDRYLHMLILGPTGSGKTSQTIIPMIHRDIQNPDLGITVIEPKGDLAEKIFAMAKYYGREVEYFNPILKDCPYFNPLYGDETDAIENIVTTFKMLSPDSPQFFQDQNEGLIRKSMQVIKRLYKNDATLLHLETLIHNTGGEGEKMVKEFMKLSPPNESIIKENRDIATWFLSDYFTGAKGSRTATKTYEHTSGVRTQVMKLNSNKFLRKVLNPPVGHGSDINFDKALEEGKVITIATAQGKLRDLGKFLGYFIILQLQSAVFRRPGNENTRRGNMLYIDEFQVYANPGFEDMLTQGRSYRVASHLATQTRALIGRGGQQGKDFLEVVSTNARNLVIYPGGSGDDAAYYERLFGEEQKTEVMKGISRQRLTPATLFAPFKPEQESIREATKMEAKYSLTDLMYQPFGRVFYRFIKNNSIQQPGISQIEYIPIELNNLLDKMVEEYNAEKDVLQHTSSDNDSIDEDKQTSLFDESGDESGVDDPMTLITQNKQQGSQDNNYIFVNEKNEQAKTQNDLIDTEEEEIFEF